MSQFNFIQVHTKKNSVTTTVGTDFELQVRAKENNKSTTWLKCSNQNEYSTFAFLFGK